MSKILNKLGLVTVKEYERAIKQRNEVLKMKDKEINYLQVQCDCSDARFQTLMKDLMLAKREIKTLKRKNTMKAHKMALLEMQKNELEETNRITTEQLADSMTDKYLKIQLKPDKRKKAYESRMRKSE